MFRLGRTDITICSFSCEGSTFELPHTSNGISFCNGRDISINLPFVVEVRTAPRTILSRPLIKDLTRLCFHLLEGVALLSLVTQNYVLFCHTSFVQEVYSVYCILLYIRCKIVSKSTVARKGSKQ